MLIRSEWVSEGGRKGGRWGGWAGERASEWLRIIYAYNPIIYAWHSSVKSYVWPFDCLRTQQRKHENVSLSIADSHDDVIKWKSTTVSGFTVWGRVIVGTLGRHQCCWCPGSLFRRAIRFNAIDYLSASLWCFCLRTFFSKKKTNWTSYMGFLYIKFTYQTKDNQQSDPGLATDSPSGVLDVSCMVVHSRFMFINDSWCASLVYWRGIFYWFLAFILNTLRSRQIGRHFADDTFKRIFLKENVRIPIEISMKFVPKSPIDNIPALFQIMAWRRHYLKQWW